MTEKWQKFAALLGHFSISFSIKLPQNHGLL